MSKEMMLKGNELFKSLSVEEVARISAFSSVKEFNSNDIIFIHGRPGTHVYMLMEGMVRLQLPSDAQEFNFNITKIGKGELFGISSLLNSRNCLAPLARGRANGQ
jgi:signal-transduction protein with cAMP-binding, CBS, and nucleotidyltransferase domain